MTISNSNPNKPVNPQPVARAERERAIAEIAKRKADAQARAGAASSDKAPAPGSRDARRAEATASGVVKPSKSDRPAKIPGDKNLVKPKTFAGVKSDKDVYVEDDTSTATEGDIRDRKAAQKGADAELDAAVKPKRTAKDPDELTVGDVARELGLDPKRARARLRAAGKAAVEGRWPKVKRQSPEHDALVALLSAAEGLQADKADES